jgi:hypothetical protein
LELLTHSTIKTNLKAEPNRSVNQSDSPSPNVVAVEKFLAPTPPPPLLR